MGSDIFDSFRRYQSRLIREYNRLAKEFHFITINACRPVETIQADLRRYISAYLNRSLRQSAAPVAETSTEE